MSWFKRQQGNKGDVKSSPMRQPGAKGGGKSGGPSTAMAQRPRSGTDPDTCLEVYKSHWLQGVTIMNKANGASASSKRSGLQEEVDTVCQHLDQMMLLMVEEEGEGREGHGQGPILQYLLAEDIMEKILTWSFRVGENTDRLRLQQLKTYDILISQANQQLLIHKPIIRPLLKLLVVCAEHPSKVIEKHVILLLHQLCVCVTQNTQILELLFNASSDHGPAKFLMFSLLIPYVHREGTIGQQARDALLLIMALSSMNEHIGKYIANNSDFCPVLATGLSGLYSSLPRKLNIPADDWYQLAEEDIQNMPDLIQFLNSLEFCNAVVQVAHPLVRDQLITFIHNGFLVPVIGPALHQNSMEEVIAATSYLELFIRRITEPALIQTFLLFILQDKHDDINILDSLIGRINSNSRLCMVSLSLFRTVVELNCEDAMFQLVLKYLIPCTHVMVSQRRSVKDLDLYSKTAEKFLSLTPTCCLPDASDTPPDGAATPLAPDSPSSSSSSTLPSVPEQVSIDSVSPDIAAHKPAIPLPTSGGLQAAAFSVDSKKKSVRRLGFLKRSSKQQFLDYPRQRSASVDQHVTGTQSSEPSAQSGLGDGAPVSVNGEAPHDGGDRRSSSPEVLSRPVSHGGLGSKLEHFETSYMEYLEEAHTKIQHCANACRCWSFTYDGEKPPPTSLIDDSPADDSGTIADSDATPVVTPSAEPHGSVFLNAHKQLTNKVHFEETSDTIKIESHGQSPGNSPRNLENPPGGSTEEGVRSSTPTKESSHKVDDTSKLPIIPEGSKLHTSQKDSYAESVTSEADSALSGSSSNTDNVQNSGENPASRSDSPLNDNFDSMDFNTFLLSLKRIKTPVEFCDNIEDSIHEIDELINDLKQTDSRTGKSTSRSPSVKSSTEELPKFTDIASTDHATDIIKPNASKTSPNRLRSSSDGSLPSPIQSKPAESNQMETRLSDVSLEDKLSEFESDSSVKRALETMPHRSSSVSEMDRPRSSSEPLSAFAPLKPSLATTFTPAKYSLGTPNIGPFLSAILNKLETMMQNSLYVNLLLTGVITRLACYPQPLLRSFLLNHSLVFQPTVKSLVQVLGSVKHKVDCYSYTVKDFEQLLLRARRFLSWREESHMQGDGGRQRSDSTISLPPTQMARPHIEPHKSEKKRSGSMLGDFLFRRQQGSKGKQQIGVKDTRLQLLGDGKGAKYINRTSGGDASAAGDKMESVKTKNAVYCALVLEEFVKELAALSQEHAVLCMDEGYCESAHSNSRTTSPPTS